MTLDYPFEPLIHIVSSQPQPIAELTESRENRPDLRLERVREFLYSSNLAANTQKSYRLELERFVRWSDKAWIDVTPRDIARFKRYLMQECFNDRGKPLSASSVNQALTALKSFFKWFQLSGYLDHSTVLPTAAVKFEKLGTPLPRHLSTEQMEAIWQVLSGEEDIDLRDRSLLAVLTHGLRAEDVSLLNVGNYDGVRLRFTRKKDKGEAIVPLRQAARNHVDAYLEQRRSQREVLTSESPLFLSYDFRTPGKRLGYQGIYYFAKIKLGKAAGIVDLTPHRFRHTYASELVELGIDSLLARSLTGHRSEKVFERYIVGKRLAAAEDAFFQAIGE